MSSNVSTRPAGLAKMWLPRLSRQPFIPAGFMSRLLIILLVGFVLVIAIGIVVLGEFPPNPPQHTVSKVLPNDSIGQQH